MYVIALMSAATSEMATGTAFIRCPPRKNSFELLLLRKNRLPRRLRVKTYPPRMHQSVAVNIVVTVDCRHNMTEILVESDKSFLNREGVLVRVGGQRSSEFILGDLRKRIGFHCFSSQLLSVAKQIVRCAESGARLPHTQPRECVPAPPRGTERRGSA